MLVYANSLKLEPEDGIEQIVKLVATWVGKVSGPGSFVEPQKLIQGIKEFKLKDGITLTARSTLNRPDTNDFPRFFSVRFSHPDSKVSGRRWTTEIGLRHDSINSPVDCSIILKTEEISAKVYEPVKVTRPRLMVSLFEKCRPTTDTPGLFIKALNDKNYATYINDLENEDRRRPIILVSSLQGERYSIDPEKLRATVIGLADIYVLEHDANTFKLENLAGRRFTAFGGAVRIIFPKRKNSDFNESILLSNESLFELSKTRMVESEILATITHRTNIPLSWQHISLEFVDQVILRAKLRSALEKTKKEGNNVDHLQNVELLELAYSEVSARDSQVASLQEQFEEQQHDNRRLQSVIQGLRHSLSVKQGVDNPNEHTLQSLLLIRESLKKLEKNELSLESALRTCSVLYQDRLIVLDSAFKSAQASDSSAFKNTSRAYDLLIKLADSYWSLLNNGGGDQQAKEIFGNNAYAANEANLSSEGQRMREFLYNGNIVQMDKHLKHGFKESPATTLRIHFEWFAETRHIVIGHCGRHLDL